MGFLDFLKKDKPQPAPLFTQDNVPPPPAPSDLPPLPSMPDLPHDPAQIDWSSPPALEPLPKSPIVRDDQAPLPSKMSSTEEPMTGDAEPAPEPPRSPQPIPEPAQPASDQATSAVELPDFTEEDLAALENATLPALPSLPSVKMVTEESIVPLPANAIELPDDDIKLPTGETIEPSRIEAAKFVSSSTYFTIIADIKGTRKSLRQSDDTIKEAILRHEQLDLQYKRVATDMNAVQEHLIRIDGALFE